MSKQLPHLAGFQEWLYTCKSTNYTWQTIVRARSIKEARQRGYREARAVMGTCGVIREDKVEPFLPNQ